jgi:hypothetical protein
MSPTLIQGASAKEGSFVAAPERSTGERRKAGKRSWVR